VVERTDKCVCVMSDIQYVRITCMQCI